MSHEELDQQTKFKIEAMVKQWGEEMRSESVLICSKSGGRYKDKARKYNQCGHLGEDEEVDITYFQGKYDPELYLQWERNMEIAFCHHNYSEFKKVNLASRLLSDSALTWWDRLAKSRRRNGVEPIMTWKEMKAVMRKHFAPSHYYRENHYSWRQSQATTVSYSTRSFREKEEQPKEYIRPFVKQRSDAKSTFTPVQDDGGVVTKDEKEDPKKMVMEELDEEVEEIEAPPGPLTLFNDSDLDVQNEEYDGEQQEDVIHEDEVSIVSLTPTQVDEDNQVQLSNEAEMVKSKEEKVETNEYGLMHESLLDQSSALGWIMNEEKSMEAKWNKGNVSSTNDLDCLFPSTYSFVQAFDDVSSKYTFHGVLSIKGSEYQIEFERLNELETCEEIKKQNFFPFDVGDGQDLRTNPLQEEGNDGARKSWFEARSPRIIDDMG